MKQQGIALIEGITPAQLDEAERRYGIHFPKKLRAFYEIAMPISEGFVNWIDDSAQNQEQIQKRLAFPLRGILIAIEIEAEEIWPFAWGNCPSDPDEAVELAKEYLKNAAPLIPIYGHRYMPYLETSVEPPVLSVYGGDLIYYGFSLTQWFQKEFGIRSDSSAPAISLDFPENDSNQTAPSILEIPGWQEFIS